MRLKVRRASKKMNVTQSSFTNKNIRQLEILAVFLIGGYDGPNIYIDNLHTIPLPTFSFITYIVVSCEFFI